MTMHVSMHALAALSDRAKWWEGLGIECQDRQACDWSHVPLGRAMVGAASIFKFGVAALEGLDCQQCLVLVDQVLEWMTPYETALDGLGPRIRP